MITKKIILNLFFFVFILTIINAVSAYSFQVPVCNSTINDSCINFVSTAPITTAPTNGLVYWKDGYLYFTNETPIDSINNTYIYTYNNTIYTGVSYNISNGSTITIIQNITANDTIIRNWVYSQLNSTFYNKSEADIAFVPRTEFNPLRDSLPTTYVTITDLNSKYSYLLAINGSEIINGTISSGDGEKLTITWKIIIIINCVLIVILLIAIIKIMMAV